MAKINIWISAMDNPCGVDDKHPWYITIYDCDGNVLQWCGKKYVVMPAKCGHLQVEVPPGVYYIKAVWGFKLIGSIYYVNHFTDAAIVEACCEKTVCVKLFNPSIHRCGTIILRAIKDMVMQKAIKADVAKKHEAMLNEILADVPKPAKSFELAHLDELEALVMKAERERK